MMDPRDTATRARKHLKYPALSNKPLKLTVGGGRPPAA